MLCAISEMGVGQMRKCVCIVGIPTRDDYRGAAGLYQQVPKHLPVCQYSVYVCTCLSMCVRVCAK